MPLICRLFRRTLPESSFRNLTGVTFLSLAYNKIEEIPRHVLSHMPKLITLDMGRARIRKIGGEDLRNLKELRTLICVYNEIEMLERDCFPKQLVVLSLSENRITSLNGTLRDLENLNVLFLNHNKLTSIDGELSANLSMLHSLLIHHNRLTSLPKEISNFRRLESLYLSHNEFKNLDGLIKNLDGLSVLDIQSNRLEHLARDEFQFCTNLHELDLSNNWIKSINGSLLPAGNLTRCEFSRNLLTEFSFDEIRGLEFLQKLALSHNKIEKLTGRLQNTVESDLYVVELLLDNNLLQSLEGALMGMSRLRKLSLSFNQLDMISPEDLIGLDELEYLDISHNFLLTLQETSKVRNT